MSLKVWLLVLLISAIAGLARGDDLAPDHTLPNLAITPGVSTLASVEEICNKRWGRDVRHVTQAMRRKVFHNYGLTGNDDDSWCHLDAHERRFEVDHLVSRELGGADDVLNLWPQCYSGPWGAMVKDRLENRLHKEVCAGLVTLDEAQYLIRTDWQATYRRYFGNPEPHRQ